MLLVLIEAYNDQITLDISFCGWLGASKEKWSDEKGYDIRLTSIKALSIILNTHSGAVLPIGSIEFMQRAAEILGIKLPPPINIPETLKSFCGRKTWTSNIKDLHYPCFVKPLNDLKKFTGFVAKAPKDFALYPEMKGFNGELFCSEIIENIQSEWRCFVLDGKILNCSNYAGDPLLFPDKFKIEMFISKYFDAPIGYSLDVCVTKDGTKLVEINDGWSIGNFGCDPQDYFKILRSRWRQILNDNTKSLNELYKGFTEIETEDEPDYYKNVDIIVNGVVHENWHRLSNGESCYYGSLETNTIIPAEEVTHWKLHPDNL